MSQEQTHQAAGSAAQDHLGVETQQDVDSESAPSTPVTVRAISPVWKASPSGLMSDSTLEMSSAREEEKSLQTERDEHSEAQAHEDDITVAPIEDGEIIDSIQDDGEDGVEDDGEGDKDEMVYIAPPHIVKPKTQFHEVFFAPQGDPALIPPIPGARSQYPKISNPTRETATSKPKSVPQHIFEYVIASGRAERPLGPGIGGIHPSARDLVATVMDKYVAPMQDMAERLQNHEKILKEKTSVIEELGKTLNDPEAAAQSTEIGELKARNEYMADRVQALFVSEIALKNESIATKDETIVKLGETIATKDEIIVNLREIIAPKDEIIVKLRETIASLTNKNGFTQRGKSNKILKQKIANQEATITELQNEVIEYRTKDMTKMEADLAEKKIRGKYAHERLEYDKKLHEAEMEEQTALIAHYEERMREQDTLIRNLQLVQAQNAQDIKAAEKRIAEFTGRESTLIEEKTGLSDRVRVLNEELKDRSKELRESDEQLTIARKGREVAQAEIARLKNEILNIAHERTMLKGRLTQAGNWEQEKYTKNLASEELKQQMAAMKEDIDRMSDKHRFQIENLEVTTREKIKNERKEANRKRRKVQEELVALRGRALTNPSGTESEQDPDSANAMNVGKSLEEELSGSSGSPESSPTDKASIVAANGGNNTQASPNRTQDQPRRKHPPHSFKHKETPQSEEDTASSAENEIPIRAGRIRSRPVTLHSRPVFTPNTEIPRDGEHNIDGEAQPEDDSTLPQQSLTIFDNEAQQEGDSKTPQQRPPISNTKPQPDGDYKAPRQRPPNLNEQALQEGGSKSRHQRSSKLNDQTPSVSELKKASPQREAFDDQERQMSSPSEIFETAWAGGRRRGTKISGPQGSRLIINPITASSLERPQRPNRIAAGGQTSAQTHPPQEPEQAAGGSGSPAPPSGEANTEADLPQEPVQPGAGDPPPPPSSSSGSPSPPPDGGGEGGGPPGQRPRVPVMIPIFQRVPYRQGTRLGAWEGLVWTLVSLFILATFLMFMALQGERTRWLAANEGTRQMLFSLKRRGPLGTGLLTWIFDNAFLNVETNSYG